MTQEDAVNTKPAVHPSDGVTRVNCAERQDSPSLNWDHVITSRSKKTLRKGSEGVWWEDVGSIASARGCQSSVSDHSHTAIRCLECLNFTSRRALAKERQGKEEGGGEGDLKHSSSWGLLAVSQREGGFSRICLKSALSNPPHPSDRHFYICLTEDVKPENYFWHPLQGDSLANLYLLQLYNGSGVGIKILHLEWQTSKYKQKDLLFLNYCINSEFVWFQMP